MSTFKPLKKLLLAGMVTWDLQDDYEDKNGRY